MVTSIPFLVARIPDDNDFLRLKEMAIVHDNWSLDYDKIDIKIWSKSVPDATIKMVKVWSVFSAVNSTDLYNTLLDPVYRKEWDPHMIVGYEIGHLNPNNGVSYYAVSCPPPLRSRDFVLQTSWLDRSSEFFILNHSVCHKDYPPRQGFIRAISYFTGYFIKTLPVNGCEMSFVSQTDPQGIIPAWIVNKCTQIFGPRFVRQLEKAARGYGAWKSQNNPLNMPWLYPEQMTSEKITILDCVPSEEEQHSTFFKYLAEKAAKSQAPKPAEDQPIRAKFSSPNIPASSKTFREGSEPSPSRNDSKISNSPKPETERIHAEPETEEKDKKSKKTSWFDFAKLCLSKNPES